MDRRHLLGMLGAGAVGTLAVGATDARADHEGHHHEHSETMANCARSCAEAAAHCLEQLKKGGSDAEKHARALAMTAACESFCIHSFKQAICESPLAALAHEANAKACEECAKTCEGVEGSPMKECAEACRKCADACRQMAKMAGQHATSR